MNNGMGTGGSTDIKIGMKMHSRRGVARYFWIYPRWNPRWYLENIYSYETSPNSTCNPIGFVSLPASTWAYVFKCGRSVWCHRVNCPRYFPRCLHRHSVTFVRWIGFLAKKSRRMESRATKLSWELGVSLCWSMGWFSCLCFNATKELLHLQKEMLSNKCGFHWLYEALYVVWCWCSRINTRFKATSKLWYLS